MKYVNVLYEGDFDRSMLNKHKIEFEVTGFFASRNFHMFEFDQSHVAAKKNIIDELNDVKDNLGQCLNSVVAVEITYKNDENFKVISGFTFYE